MFHCIKWQHIFDSNIVPASNGGTMKHNFLWCSTGCTTLTCFVKLRCLWTSDWDDHSKTSYCHLILGPTDIHNVPPLAKFSVKLFQFSLAETAQYVRQCSWCCMQGISLLITPATIWSPMYPNLWMCLVRDSGLFIFLTQILIWSYSLAALSQLYLAWIQDKELHTHTLVQYLDCFLFLQCLTACLTILCRFLSYKWNVRPILAMSWQPHCMLTQIWVAGSAAPCFDLPLLQRTVSKPSLLLSSCGRSKFPTAVSSSRRIYIFHL